MRWEQWTVCFVQLSLSNEFSSRRALHPFVIMAHNMVKFWKKFVHFFFNTDFIYFTYFWFYNSTIITAFCTQLRQMHNCKFFTKIPTWIWVVKKTFIFTFQFYKPFLTKSRSYCTYWAHAQCLTHSNLENVLIFFLSKTDLTIKS